MSYVYLIQSIKTGQLYYGYTKDLKRRFLEHNQGKNFSTKPYAPYRLVYYEAYADEFDAKKRERQLKKFGQGIYRLQSRLVRSLKHNKM
ncbi:hypothetical protein A3E04_03495 [Candidatus Kuenenbacteria bacterium RIFCSPHIGHO2_12_FULL_42_14]|uniref:GIY-YIG domain-containing protein n=1 Tax=Candidatus Kuenenbacteria bacterium RIFCSPHIGHO2_12_FULL_42_14 TaxID=1798563 RepID=A0A1F6GKP3_9BACT|nr:MAG: hypothetical protein A3E04_03495 [Candidatus Kuenenbacteria bacterium RIFCSPHIGHO2_12_FULL_42_14]